MTTPTRPLSERVREAVARADQDGLVYRSHTALVEVALEAADALDRAEEERSALRSDLNQMEAEADHFEARAIRCEQRVKELERIVREDNATSNDIADYAEKRLRRLALADRLVESVISHHHSRFSAEGAEVMAGQCHDKRMGHRCQRIWGHRWHYNAQLGQEWGRREVS